MKAYSQYNSRRLELNHTECDARNLKFSKGYTCIASLMPSQHLIYSKLYFTTWNLTACHVKTARIRTDSVPIVATAHMRHMRNELSR
uniref:ORF44 n=1 Tax=Nitrosopumilaceae spindle-shaped virus TaxID=3065433 RepID=A0AAT9JGA9_9VIRU